MPLRSSRPVRRDESARTGLITVPTHIRGSAHLVTDAGQNLSRFKQNLDRANRFQDFSHPLTLATSVSGSIGLAMKSMMDKCWSVGKEDAYRVFSMTETITIGTCRN
jgi:thiamine pyrophosphate-dependent acetolactate synthase large subunit-like protein